MIRYFFPPQPTRIWPSSPLLLSLGNQGWDAEIKYNGWRILLFKEDKKTIKIYNRRATIIDIDHQQFLPLFETIPTGSVFDGELLDRRTKDLKGIMVLFDAMFFKDKDLRNQPLTERRKYLERFDHVPAKFSSSIVGRGQVFRIQQYTGNFLKLYNERVALNDPIEEGVVLKKTNSIYKHHPSRGIDTLDWLKVKKIGAHALVGTENGRSTTNPLIIPNIKGNQKLAPRTGHRS